LCHAVTRLKDRSLATGHLPTVEFLARKVRHAIVAVQYGTAGWYSPYAGPALAQQTGGGMLGDRPIYGRQLMTQQEMERYRERMRSAQSEEERRRIRTEHHSEIQGRGRQ
jgi:hypothetical protein